MIENLVNSIRHHAGNVGMYKTMQAEAHRQLKEELAKVNA